MKLIDISTKKFPNTFAMVDDEDFEFLNQYNWFPAKGKTNVYAARNLKEAGNGLVLMHRVVKNIEKGQFIDHIDHNGLNNTKENLRIATKSENACNSRKKKTNKSGYIGVSWSLTAKKWWAQIKFRGRSYNLGYGDDLVAMAKKRDDFAKKLHGDFAYLNKY